MAEILEEAQDLESTTVAIYRTAAVVKGGRRFSFGALVVVGDRRGSVGIGYGKAPGVPAAIEKAQKDARKRMHKVELIEGTLPHPVRARYGASMVKLVPAAPGTGVIAGGTVRAILELAGVRDCLTKAYGSTNQKNLCKAALDGLRSLRTKSQVEAVRGVELGKTQVEEQLDAGRRFAPSVSARPAGPKGPQARPPKGGRGERGGGRGRGGRGGDHQNRGGAAQSSAPQSSGAQAAPQAEGGAPSTDAPAGNQ